MTYLTWTDDVDWDLVKIYSLIIFVMLIFFVGLWYCIKDLIKSYKEWREVEKGDKNGDSES